MISVFSTLRASIFLWVQNFWYLVVITLVTQTSVIFFNRISHETRSSHGFTGVFNLVACFAIVFFGAMNVAAILGLLTRTSSGKSVGQAVWICMRTYTWTLFRLTLLLGLIACLVAIPFIFINTTIKPSNTSRVFFIAFFLLLLKYALADPLVVVENMGARQALKRSWEMTKGHFVYVLGCYLFLWGGTWLIDWPLGKLDVDRLTGVDFIFQLIRSLIDTLWVVMSWCMYLRIKAADQPPVGHSESASEAEGFPAS